VGAASGPFLGGFFSFVSILGHKGQFSTNERKYESDRTNFFTLSYFLQIFYAIWINEKYSSKAVRIGGIASGN
jgi:hypothetical protein